ncbi:hypothetical protein MAPG_02771 [Magnaporthiopsis poae ATCC 64411]|uniref:Phosphatidyl synthase n=1 Tax=Magnaporthiopsis poae (strain ATCC 64411 / 73-15) TaxID=644358 RepID=A0A0C4DS94_MAGP6|nr:hypothetical protein MAPG_02771 [Magnaporthiopsis poae ATCC 64411]
MSTLQRPAGPARTASSSSFAEAFDKARHKLDKELDRELEAELEQLSLDDDSTPDLSDSESSPASPGSLASDSGAATPTLASPGTPLTAPLTPLVDPDVAEDFAFAFDIDGVLIRGGNPIPEAIEAMKVLNGENQYGVKVPYIFLTNGGGKTEAERCKDLSKQLEIEVSTGQFICGHTPMRELAEQHRTVLVIGGEGEKCREVAEGYGFTDVITPGDIIKANAATAPFRKLTPQEHANCRDLLARTDGDLTKIVIEAIFVFADSRDWASDLQIILDVAMSKGGRLETRSENFDEGPPVFFSHNDTLWAAQHEHARLGMGALRRIVEVVFADVTQGKGKLRTHSFGKPQVPTFEILERVNIRTVRDYAANTPPPETVYFVGDTPESDIRGTNAMDAVSDNEWYSILVKTGIYQDGTVPAYKPRSTVGTVLDAVHHGIEREMERRRAKASAEKLGDGIFSAGRVPQVEVVEP